MKPQGMYCGVPYLCMLKLLLWQLQAGALAVAPDRAHTGGSGGSEPSTPIAPAGATPMDSDQAILSSALNTSGTQDSDSVPQSSATPASEVPSQAADGPSASDSASDYVMVEAAAAGDAGAAVNEMGVTGPSGANEPGVTKPKEGGGIEGDIARMGFAVQLVIQGLRNGAGPTLMPLLVRLLPYLLKTQVQWFQSVIYCIGHSHLLHDEVGLQTTPVNRKCDMIL